MGRTLGLVPDDFQHREHGMCSSLMQSDNTLMFSLVPAHELPVFLQQACDLGGTFKVKNVCRLL